MEGVADHCAGDVWWTAVRHPPFFMAGIILKTMERFGVFLFHGKGWKKSWKSLLRIMKKGLEFLLTPFNLLVAGRGFEPLTFGL
jgi:hypothetical protein